MGREHDVDEAHGPGGVELSGLVEERLEVLARRSVWDSGSLAMLHSTTLGWFLSRATSSRIAWTWTSWVASLMVSAENVA